MILDVCWDGLWTFSFGLSQFHGDCSWLVLEVALNIYCAIDENLVVCVSIWVIISSGITWTSIEMVIVGLVTRMNG